MGFCFVLSLILMITQCFANERKGKLILKRTHELIVTMVLRMSKNQLVTAAAIYVCYTWYTDEYTFVYQYNVLILNYFARKLGYEIDFSRRK